MDGRFATPVVSSATCTALIALRTSTRVSSRFVLCVTSSGAPVYLSLLNYRSATVLAERRAYPRRAAPAVVQRRGATLSVHHRQRRWQGGMLGPARLTLPPLRGPATAPTSRTPTRLKHRLDRLPSCHYARLARPRRRVLVFPLLPPLFRAYASPRPSLPSLVFLLYRCPCARE